MGLTMIAENQLREKLGRYLSNELSLDHFEDWLVNHSWNMHKDSNESAQKLASAIELRLAEYSSGHLDEIGLRDELRQFVNSYTVQVSFSEAPLPIIQEPPNNVVTEAKTLVVAFPVRLALSQAAEGPSALVDRSRAVALASG
jgi:hypothetical protein